MKTLVAALLALWALALLFALALCRAAKQADEAAEALHMEPGSGMFDR
jgi:hypothetical protein